MTAEASAYNHEAFELRASDQVSDDIASVAYAYWARPKWRENLESFHEFFVQKRSEDRQSLPDDYFVRERNGGEMVNFEHTIFAGATAAGELVQVCIDGSGYHKLVRLSNPDTCLMEPRVYDATDRTEVGHMRVDFALGRNTLPCPWIPAARNAPEPTLADRDSVYLTVNEAGNLTCTLHDGLTKSDHVAYPLEDIVAHLEAIDAQPNAAVIDITSRLDSVAQ